jgi:hypothetical protein
VARAPDIPERWTRLQDLLRRDPEFEARYPEAYNLLFEQEAAAGLYLPSFGVRILDYWPRTLWFRADVYSMRLPASIASDVRDPLWPHPLRVPALPDHEKPEMEVLGRFPPMYADAWVWFSHPHVVAMEGERLATHIRGILLAIMGRDEITARGLGSLSLIKRTLHEDPAVRITDLRLAADLFTTPPRRKEDVRKMLRRVTETLSRPITHESILQWKRHKLQTIAKEPGAHQDDVRRDEVTAIAFATAGICLLLDLGMPDLEDASPLLVSKHLVELADEINKLTRRLDNASKGLQTLVANRSEGRPGRSESECLLALSCYRLGYEPKQIAEWNGIKPFDYKSTQRGTKNWRKRLTDVLVRGVDIEKKRYSRAAEIFDQGDDAEVAAKAAKAYRAWAWAVPAYAFAKASEIVGVNILTEQEREIVAAYVQLGSCQYHNIPARPEPYE